MLRTASRLLVVAGTVVAATAGALALRADLLIGYGFSRALQAYAGTPPFKVAAAGGRTGAAEVGDERHWLEQRGQVTPRPVVARAYLHQLGDAVTRPATVSDWPLFVGQRTLIVSPTDGSQLYVEVAAIDFVGTPTVNVSVSDGASVVQLMRLTFRVLNLDGTYVAGRDAPVHLWLQLQTEAPAKPPASHRT